jgi:hypothetical protein
VLSETFESKLDAENVHRNNSTILALLSTNSVAPGNDPCPNARDLRSLVAESVTYLARERQALRNRLYNYEQEHSMAVRQVSAAQDRLRNVRRTLFVDTLRGQDPTMADPFIYQDSVTLLKWLKDALEAGRLSAPTAADLSNTLTEADHEGTL